MPSKLRDVLLARMQVACCMWHSCCCSRVAVEPWRPHRSGEACRDDRCTAQHDMQRSALVCAARCAAQQPSSPVGSGSSTRPVTVATKMAVRVQALEVMPAGQGTRKLIARPSSTTARVGTSLAPWERGGGRRCERNS